MTSLELKQTRTSSPLAYRYLPEQTATMASKAGTSFLNSPAGKEWRNYLTSAWMRWLDGLELALQPALRDCQALTSLPASHLALFPRYHLGTHFWVSNICA